MNIFLSSHLFNGFSPPSWLQMIHRFLLICINLVDFQINQMNGLCKFDYCFERFLIIHAVWLIVKVSGHCFYSRSGEVLQPKGDFKMAKHHQGCSSQKHQLLPASKIFPLSAKEKIVYKQSQGIPHAKQRGEDNLMSLLLLPCRNFHNYVALTQEQSLKLSGNHLQIYKNNLSYRRSSEEMSLRLG